MSKKYVYFRNDDVNSLDPELVAITNLLTDNNIPIIHAVEPANVSDDTIAWLNEMKAQKNGLLEIMQHGYDHMPRELGEFGGTRSYESQYQDISQGLKKMKMAFGENFLPAVNFPFGFYNQYTIEAVNNLGFEIVSSHYNFRLSRRILYAVGNYLKKGQLFGKHISHHLNYYPNTSLFEIDMCISLIDKYLGNYLSKECIFIDADQFMSAFNGFKECTSVIGILLHHRFHNTEKSLNLISAIINKLNADKDIVYVNLSQIYQMYKSN